MRADHYLHLLLRMCDYSSASNKNSLLVMMTLYKKFICPCHCQMFRVNPRFQCQSEVPFLVMLCAAFSSQ